MKNIMKRITKYLGLMLGALGMTVMAPVTSHAITSLETKTNTAVAKTIGNGQVMFDLTIRTVANNQPLTGPAAQVNWANVSLPQSFVIADDYVQFNSTLTQSGGFIEIYTDNVHSPDPAAKFSGNISSVTALPSGLVDEGNTKKTLPLIWSIHSATQTIVALGTDVTKPGSKPNELAPANPNDNGVVDPFTHVPHATDNNAFQWFFMEDNSQVANPSLDANVFVATDTYITVLNENGIHFAQGPDQPTSNVPDPSSDPKQWGAASSPTYIYFETDFRAALTPRTYKTAALTMQAFQP